MEQQSAAPAARCRCVQGRVQAPLLVVLKCKVGQASRLVVEWTCAGGAAASGGLLALRSGLGTRQSAGSLCLEAASGQKGASVHLMAGSVNIAAGDADAGGMVNVRAGSGSQQGGELAIAEQAVCCWRRHLVKAAAGPCPFRLVLADSASVRMCCSLESGSSAGGSGGAISVGVGTGISGQGSALSLRSDGQACITAGAGALRAGDVHVCGGASHGTGMSNTGGSAALVSGAGSAVLCASSDGCASACGHCQKWRLAVRLVG